MVVAAGQHLKHPVHCLKVRNTAFSPIFRKHKLKISLVQNHCLNMPSRTSKNKSTTEIRSIAPVTPTPAVLQRQRTQTTKQQLLGKSQLRCFTHRKLFLIIISLLEQEKASKVKTAKDKAYQEAVRSQQRQEELIGFQKIPAQGIPPPSDIDRL